MFSVFRRKAASSSPKPKTPVDTRIYAIGDIHGCADLLAALATRIEKDLERSPQHVVTIFLGDYIDRGPRSFDVIERLASKDFPTTIIALRGNHEQIMIEAMEDAAAFARWRAYGGLETMMSYDVDLVDIMRGKGFESAQQSLREKVPQKHLDFLENLPLSHQLGDYFFCHAGVRPGVPTARQEARDLLWIRKEFLHSTETFDKFVIHGHTPVEEPDIRVNRANIDVGAYATGRLSCLVLEGEDRRFLFA